MKKIDVPNLACGFLEGGFGDFGFVPGERAPCGEM
tara:strand:+ start:97 stop:201 length:105 start_codon:yes stop_codon:yes gene_type:complete